MCEFRYKALVTAPVTLSLSVPFEIGFEHRENIDFDVERDVGIGVYDFITANSCERFVRMCNNELRGSARRVA